VSETVTLAKKYGIATPYTSYLVVPDGPVPVAGNFRGGAGFGMGQGGSFGGGAFDGAMGGIGPRSGGRAAGVNAPADPTKQLSVESLARQVQGKPGDLQANRAKLEDAKQLMIADKM